MQIKSIQKIFIFIIYKLTLLKNGAKQKTMEKSTERKK